MLWAKRIGAVLAMCVLLGIMCAGPFILYKEISPVGWWAFGTVENDDGVAIGGYDAVSYASGTPMRGLEAHTIEHKGVIWRFASDENRHAFALDRARYEPAFNGFCAFAVSKGVTAAVDPEIWAMDGDRLVLFADEGVRRQYEDEGLSAMAHATWVEPPAP